MTPKLAPHARYRIIPHPNPRWEGGSAIVADEAAPLDDKKTRILATWLTDTVPAAPTGKTTNAYTHAGGCGYTLDEYPNAPLYDVGGKIRALAPDLAAMLHRPMIRTILGDSDALRVFGLTADGTLCVAVATLDPAYLEVP